MRKLRNITAILIVLFACQAVFAGAFVKVNKAESAVAARYAGYADVIQTLEIKNGGGSGFYMTLASSTDEQIDEIFATYGVNAGLKAVTTLEELAVLFPRGIEACDARNAFRRTALHLAFNTQYRGKLHSEAIIDNAEVKFNIVGYDFLVRLADDTIIFKYLDVVSADEVSLIGEALKAIVPGAKSWSNPMAGEVDVKTEGLSAFGFAAFVAQTQGLIYDTIY